VPYWSSQQDLLLNFLLEVIDIIEWRYFYMTDNTLLTELSQNVRITIRAPILLSPYLNPIYPHISIEHVIIMLFYPIHIHGLILHKQTWLQLKAVLVIGSPLVLLDLWG
jgi:hypothetical protein